MAHSTMSDLEIAHLLCNRILVTRRAGGEFRYIAPIHEFSIIDVAECLQDDLASVAYEISQHWNQLKLRDKQPFNVWFENGDVKIVDVKVMRGHNKMFAPV